MMLIVTTIDSTNVHNSYIMTRNSLSLAMQTQTIVRFGGRWLLSFLNFCKIHILHSYKDGGSREGGWFSCFFPQVLFTKRETSQVGVPRSIRKNYEKPLDIFEQQHCFVLKISRYHEFTWYVLICHDLSSRCLKWEKHENLWRSFLSRSWRNSVRSSCRKASALRKGIWRVTLGAFSMKFAKFLREKHEQLSDFTEFRQF